MRTGDDAEEGMEGLEVETGRGTFEKRGISTATTTGSALLCDTDEVAGAEVRLAMTWRSRGTTAPRNTFNHREINVIHVNYVNLSVS